MFPHPPASLPWQARGLLAIAGVVLLALLITAARLEPAPRGFGTHQQLGLPPCTLTVLFGMRCPSCGMTTAWAHATRGNLWSAANANVGGALLAVAAAFAAPWCLAAAWMGRNVWPWPKPWIAASVMGVILLITTVEWLYRLIFT